MAVESKIIVLSTFIFVTSDWLLASGSNVTSAKHVQDTPSSVDSRFFDLGQLFNPPLPNFNQNRPALNSGSNLPQNSPFNPTSQGNFPKTPSPGNQWGISNQDNLRPPQNQGPNGPTQWQNPQFSNQEEIQRPNYLNILDNYQVQRPNQFPAYDQNVPNWSGLQSANNNVQGPNQFPIQGGTNNLYTQIQLPSNQVQDWYQPRPLPNPDQNRPIQLPDQANQRPNNGINNYPNQYPDSGPQGQDFNQRPNQLPDGNYQYPSQGWQSPSDGGTVDDVASQINNGEGKGNAILGKPVIIPTTTVNPDKVFFNNSSDSENPLQRQCVQDCPASPEYNPICGTNNVTYFNPGKFVCARNCGVSVYVARRGVCRRRPM